MSANFVIKQTTWNINEQALTMIRETVFIKEQKVPVDLEWDDFDAVAVHLLAIDESGSAIGCARVVNDHIGRMAVLKRSRGKGVGQALLKAAVEACTAFGYKKARLSAQTQAVPFYEKQGFEVVSKPYLDANIWHVGMQLNI